MRAESKAKKGKGKVGTIVLFLALPVLLLIVFTYIPFVDMFKNSLTDWDGIYEAETAGGKKVIRAAVDKNKAAQGGVNTDKKIKATNGSRTRDLNITNVALYHLSYSSLLFKSNNNYNKMDIKNQVKYLHLCEK